MKGKHHIVIETARIQYEFDIKRNITIIQGDSATGKTTLIGLLQAYAVNGEKSGVMVSSDVQCYVYSGASSAWSDILSAYNCGIVFIDEDYDFVRSKEFAGFIQKTDNYYVLITRRDLYNLPYSTEEIYGIRTSGKYHFPQKIYNEFYHIFSDEYDAALKNPVLITEDANSGFQFFSKAYDTTRCISADGNANILKKISEVSPDQKLVVIADGAAFGAYISKVISLAYIRKNILLYFPESFEWLVLKSGIIESHRIEEILQAPENYIESSKYFSWEQFFTELLKNETADDHIKRYDKSSLGSFYTSAKNIQKILSTMPDSLRNVIS